MFMTAAVQTRHVVVIAHHIPNTLYDLNDDLRIPENAFRFQKLLFEIVNVLIDQNIDMGKTNFANLLEVLVNICIPSSLLIYLI